MDYKTCIGDCGQILPATTEFFHKRGSGLFAECKACHSKRAQKWQKTNRKGFAIIKKKYRDVNKEKIGIYNKEWKKNNPDKCNVYEAKRRARKLNQTPYLTETENQQIINIYKKREALGPDWHVDHIIPLSKGGLHHPDNLQIVTKKYNLQKGLKLNFRLPTNNEVFNQENKQC